MGFFCDCCGRQIKEIHHKDPPETSNTKIPLNVCISPLDAVEFLSPLNLKLI